MAKVISVLIKGFHGIYHIAENMTIGLSVSVEDSTKSPGVFWIEKICFSGAHVSIHQHYRHCSKQNKVITPVPAGTMVKNFQQECCLTLYGRNSVEV